MLEVLVEILLETSPNKRNMLSELAMLQATSKILSGRNPVTVIWNITATNSRLKSHYESSLNICFNFNLSSIFGSNFFFLKKKKVFHFPIPSSFLFFPLSIFFFLNLANFLLPRSQYKRNQNAFSFIKHSRTIALGVISTLKRELVQNAAHKSRTMENLSSYKR